MRLLLVFIHTIIESYTKTEVSVSVFQYQDDTENVKIHRDPSLPLHLEGEIQSSCQCGLVEEAQSLECQYGLLP